MLPMLFSAFAVGLLGSFHCIGMCGPIALALPTIHIHSQRAVGSLVYNAGRLFTYSLLGALFGLLGEGIAIAGLQQSLTITIGGLMIILMTIPYAWRRQLNPNSVIAKGIVVVKGQMQHRLQVRTYGARFVLGSLNGLLPCGLVYISIAGAIVSGDALRGALYMLAFGLGTFPAMSIIGYLGSSITVGVRNRIRSTIPVMVVVIGVFFILRGLSLDIPYVSPVLPSAHSETVVCH